MFNNQRLNTFWIFVQIVENIVQNSQHCELERAIIRNCRILLFLPGDTYDTFATERNINNYHPKQFLSDLTNGVE